MIGKHSTHVTKQRRPRKSARLKAIQHLKERTDFKDQNILQHSFFSHSLCNTRSSVCSLLDLTLLNVQKEQMNKFIDQMQQQMERQRQQMERQMEDLKREKRELLGLQAQKLTN